MNSSIIEGFAITIFAGAIMGTNLVPLKWIRVWKWENFWFFYSIASLLVVPSCLAFLLIPHLGTVYASVSLGTMVKPSIYGALWGIAQLGAGICVAKIGLALTGSILNGLCAAFGALTPLVVQHSEQLSKPSGILLLAGILIMLAGVTLCGWAGYQRENVHTDLSAKQRRAYFSVMLLAVVSGFLAALLNIALAFGEEIVGRARAEGAPAQWAVFAVWPLALLGGLIVNLAYSGYRLSRNRTWGNFLARPREIVNPVLGGSVWMIAIAIYSSGTVFLGLLGVSAGWAIFQITMILSGNLAGILTGEWRSVSRNIFSVNMAGVATLLVATVIVGAANYALQ